MCHPVSLADTKHALNTKNMECLNSLNVTSVWSPRLTTMQENQDTDSSVDFHFGRY